MPTFEIFAYWNIRELQLVFNAVAAIVGGSDYLGLLRTLALVGVISMAMAVLAGFSQLPDFGRWLIMLAVFNAILLVPKVTVVITDRTGTQPPVTVANVPLGLASFAHEISHIGDWLTRTFETTFSLPNDIRFRSNGTLWGHRVQQEILHTKFDNSILTSNLMEFYRECVVPEFATGYVVASDMAKSNDIWTYLNGRTNPGRLVTIRAVPGSTPIAGTYGCDGAYGFLTTQILYVNTQQMNVLGKRLYPGLPTAAANAAIQSSIQTSTNYMLGISKTAMDTVKQTAMSNFMIDAQYLLPAQIGDAAGAAANLAQAQAIRSTSESYKLMAKLAESTMPKVKNIVEIVQYSVFPIILLIVLLAGHKGGLVFKAYVMSLVWIQLWPPLYAVMHMIMTIHAQELAAMTSGLGLSMSQYSMVNNAYISDEAIAGMIAATAIPAIAAAIVKGGDVGAQAIAGMSSPSREAEKAAASAATGNMQMGNASLGSQSANNLSMGQVNTRPTITQGGMSIEGASGQRVFSGQDANGNKFDTINAATAMANVPFKAQLGQKATSTLQTAAENSERSSKNEAVEANKGLVATYNKMSGAGQTHTKGDAAHTTDMTGSQAQASKAFTEINGLIDQYSKGRKLDQSQKAAIFAEAAAGASGGINVLGNGATVSGKAGTRLGSDSTTTQGSSIAQSLSHDKKFQEAFTTIQTASKQADFVTGDTTTRDGAKSIQASLADSRSHLEKSSAAHEKANAYKAALTEAKTVDGGFTNDQTTQFMEWASKTKDDEGITHSKQELVSMGLGHNGAAGSAALSRLQDRYMNEQILPEIEAKYGKPQNTVDSTYAANKGEVPSAAVVTNFDASNQGKVKTEQANNGVIPGTGPTNTVAPQVAAMTGETKTKIQAGKGGVETEGKPIKHDAIEFTNPNNSHNLANAGVNAAGFISPSATSLVNDAGLLPDASTEKANAEDRGGTVAQHAVGTLVDIGLLAVGGVGGRAGGALAKGPVKEAGKLAEEQVIANAAKKEAIMPEILEKVSGKAATEAAPKVEALTGEAAQKAAAQQAAKHEAIANKAADARVNRENVVAATYKVGGMIAGAATGGLVNNARGDIPLPDMSGTPQQAMNVVEGKIKQADELGRQIGKSAVDAVTGKPEKR